MNEASWMKRGLCITGYDPELWYPRSSAPAASLPAVGICRRCPVQPQCLLFALNGGPDTAYGVWGGKREDERRAMKRQMNGPYGRAKTGEFK